MSRSISPEADSRWLEQPCGRLWASFILAFCVLLGAAPKAAAQGFGPPAILNTDHASDQNNEFFPQVTTNGAGNWVAVWHAPAFSGVTLIQFSEIFVARSADDGATWSEPEFLNSNNNNGEPQNDFNPELTTDEQGNWVAVWDSGDHLGNTIGTDRDILVARSTNNGVSWTPVGALNTNAAADAGRDTFPQLATDGAGQWVAVWQSTQSLSVPDVGSIGTDLDILVARSTDNGASWSPPAPLDLGAVFDSGDDVAPQLATDANGNWVAVWESSDPAGGIGTDPDILVARSTDDGASWTTPAALNSDAAIDSDNDFVPQVTTDGAGNWLAVWTFTPGASLCVDGAGTDSDILVARSTDSGATWTAAVTLNSDAGLDTGHDCSPQVTSDGAGSWLAVWHSNNVTNPPGVTGRTIWEARSKNNGASWTAANRLAPPVLGSRSFSQATTDGAGNWVAVWVGPPDGADSSEIEVAVTSSLFCGDGSLDPGEDCDDGNNADGDGCPANCEVEPSTGIPVLPWAALVLLAVLLLGSSFGILGWRLRESG